MASLAGRVAIVTGSSRGIRRRSASDSQRMEPRWSSITIAATTKLAMLLWASRQKAESDGNARRLHCRS
jgi:hypothetical protein